MTCLDFQNLWQKRFDGDRVPDRGTFARHLAECPDCRSYHAAAARLEGALGLLQPPAPPDGLARRIVDRVLAERRSRRIWQRTVVGAALAASVLVALIAGYLRWVSHLTTPGPVEMPVAAPERRADPALPAAVEQQVAEAGSALLGIWNRTADQAMEPGRVLLPSKVEVPALPDAGAWSNPLEQPMPALKSAGQEVSEFEPVVSLGRFVNYFKQDLPSLEPRRSQGL